MSQNNWYALSVVATLLAGLIGSLSAQIVSKRNDKTQNSDIHKTPGKKFTSLKKTISIFSLGICFILEIIILEAIYQETKQYLSTKYLFWIVPFVLWVATSIFASSLRYKFAFWIITVPTAIFLFFEAIQSFTAGGWFVLLLLIVVIGLGISKLRQDFSRSK